MMLCKYKVNLALVFIILIISSFTSNGSSTSYADAVEKASPAVVSIQTTKQIPKEVHPFFQDPFFRSFFGDNLNYKIPDTLQAERPNSLGSGVIIDSNGYILTNHHVIKEADKIIIQLADGRNCKAKIVGFDSSTDLAVLKININKLPVIEIGNSSKLRVGDIVLAIGNPFGLGQTVTQGIVSATRQASSIISNTYIKSFIQTDAAINPGNSGGALTDAKGKLIGINTAIVSNSGSNHGIGFAIPIDLAKDIMGQLISKGKISRGFLGVQLLALDDRIARYSNYKKTDGVYIQSIVRNSAAHKAGLLPGDILISIDNKIIKKIYEAQKIVSRLKPSHNYLVEVFRNGRYLSFSVLIEEK